MGPCSITYLLINIVNKGNTNMLFFAKYWQLLAVSALALALAASGAYITLLKSEKAALFAEKESLALALQVSTDSVTRLQASIDEQNLAVKKLKEYADNREKSYLSEIAKAKATADAAKDKAAGILGRVVPQGVTSCDAANLLFNEEIKNAK
jgi:hypothetical protein